MKLIAMIPIDCKIKKISLYLSKHSFANGSDARHIVDFELRVTIIKRINEKYANLDTLRGRGYIYSLNHQ